MWGPEIQSELRKGSLKRYLSEEDTPCHLRGTQCHQPQGKNKPKPRGELCHSMEGISADIDKCWWGWTERENEMKWRLTQASWWMENPRVVVWICLSQGSGTEEAWPYWSGCGLIGVGVALLEWVWPCWRKCDPLGVGFETLLLAAWILLFSYLPSEQDVDIGVIMLLWELNHCAIWTFKVSCVSFSHFCLSLYFSLCFSLSLSLISVSLFLSVSLSLISVSLYFCVSPCLCLSP